MRSAAQRYCGKRDCARAALVLLAALPLLLMSGCHKHARVSTRNYPPPSVRRSPDGTTTARRNPGTPAVVPPVRLPQYPELDNVVPMGTLFNGYASWYAPSGKRSANGEVYDGNDMTAAHRTLPLGTVLHVTNLATGQDVTVRITDRGPFVHGRMLDLSTAAAKAAGVYRMGVAPVRIEIVQERPDASPVGRWCVQIGAFADGSNADDLRAALQRQYSTAARVIEFQGATGMWVRVNPVQSDRAHAMAILRNVRVVEPDAAAWLVRLD